MYYSDWSIWTAATTTRSDVRDQIINAVVKYTADGKNNLPLSDWYDTLAGTQADPSNNYARPVVGGHLALVNLFRSKMVRISFDSLTCRCL